MKSNIESFADVIREYNPKNNMTRNVLTRFEVTKIIGMRLEQLARGAQPYVNTQGLNLRAIALKELEERKIPYMIVRSLPNNKKEYWRLTDMVFDVSGLHPV